MPPASSAATPLANAIVALATYYQFSRGECISHPCVRSRMFLWCKAGSGIVRANGENYAFTPDIFLLLPWKHSVAYQPDDREPMFVGGVHIIPAHDRGKKLVREVGHRDDDPLSGLPWRADVNIRGWERVQRGTLAHDQSLRHLAEYAIQRLAGGQRPDWEARHLAQLLLAALSDHFNAPTIRLPPAPIELQRIVQFVHNHLHEKISLEELAVFANLSPSAVGRLFRRHLKTTPVAFITRAKVTQAQQLLSTSRMSVGAIGRRVGIDDPYYFSKLFRKMAGCSPLAYRQKATLL